MEVSVQDDTFGKIVVNDECERCAIDLFRQRSPSVAIVRNQGIGSVLLTSYLLMLGNAEVLRKDRILPFAFVSIDV